MGQGVSLELPTTREDWGLSQNLDPTSEDQFIAQLQQDWGWGSCARLPGTNQQRAGESLLTDGNVNAEEPLADNPSPEGLIRPFKVSFGNQAADISGCSSRLIEAASSGSCDIILTELNSGEASVDDQQTDTGRTALHYAAMNGHLDAAHVLLGHGASVDIADYAGHTSFHLATEMDHHEMLKLLIDSVSELPALVDVLSFRAVNGSLALHHGAANNATQCSELIIDAFLRDNGFCIRDWKDNWGLAPSEVATRNGHHTLAKYLRVQQEELATSRASRPRHFKARTQLNQFYPRRFQVPDDKTDWAVPWPEYSPVPYTDDSVIDNGSDNKIGGWADPDDVAMMRDQWKYRHSDMGPIEFHSFRKLSPDWPRNPFGRTGMCERGLLGCWGPNHAVDPVVTRWAPSRQGVLQVCAIRRKDTNGWALPGEMKGALMPSDGVSAKLLHALELGWQRRESVLKSTRMPINWTFERKEWDHAVSDLLRRELIIVRGYVDDPRNTDNAWMESRVSHFHCTDYLAKNLDFGPVHDEEGPTQPMTISKPGDLKWVDIDDNNPEFSTLFGNHADWVCKAILHLRGNKSIHLRGENSGAGPLRRAASKALDDWHMLELGMARG